MQLFAKFKKILRWGFRATLNFRKFKVALNPLRRIILNFAKSCILSSYHAKLCFLFVLWSVNSFAMSVVESLRVPSLCMLKTVRLLNRSWFILERSYVFSLRAVSLTGCIDCRIYENHLKSLLWCRQNRKNHHPSAALVKFPSWQLTLKYEHHPCTVFPDSFKAYSPLIVLCGHRICWLFSANFNSSQPASFMSHHVAFSITALSPTIN